MNDDTPPVLDDMDFDVFKRDLGAKELWMVSAKTGQNIERCMNSLDSTSDPDLVASSGEYYSATKSWSDSSISITVLYISQKTAFSEPDSKGLVRKRTVLPQRVCSQAQICGSDNWSLREAPRKANAVTLQFFSDLSPLRLSHYECVHISR
eukprot:sb/3473524/